MNCSLPLKLLLMCAAIFLVGAAPAGSPLKRMTWQVGDQTREALVYIPADPGKNPPVIVAFHGHGGRAELAARKFSFHTLWPEAICIYPQGIPTPTPQVDPAGKLPGWQKAVGDEGDRDLKFFDAMLATMNSDYKINQKQVFVVGHSNGGFFTYVLWAARGDKIAAVAPISAFLNPRDAKTLSPKSVLHVAGQKDPLVKFDAQQKMIDQDKKVDGCTSEGKPAGEFCTQYRAKDGISVITYIHPGGHGVPDGAPKRIIEFFKDIAATEPKSPAR